MRGRAVVSGDEFEEGRGAVKKGGGGLERDDDEDEEEEEEEGQDEYEKNGFIVDDIEEEEEEENENRDSDEERRRKKKKKRRESEKNYVLDEDDYELLQDNNITGFGRPKPGSKFKRLKKAGRDSEVGERFGFADEGESDRNSHRVQRTAEEKLKRSLFGDDEVAPLEDIAGEEEQPEEEDGDMIGEEDEMADFIVEEEDVDEHGVVVKKKKIKKKKPRQAPGVSPSALQEAHEIFGDVDELLVLHKKGVARAARDAAGWGEKRLEDEFEPFILSEKYMTPKDDAIREADIPERIQLSEEITGTPPTDDESIEEESVWIHSQLKGGGLLPQFGSEQGNGEKDKEDTIDKEDIGRVLTMLHVQKLDLPFIAMYRKELCPSLLKDPEGLSETEDQSPKFRWHKLLWEVHTLDRKWLLLQKRKNALQMYYSRRFEEEARRVDDETRLALNRQVFESISGLLKDVKSEWEVDDIDAKFNLHFPPGEVDADEGQFKRPKRKSLYSTCYKAGLWEVANKFGYRSEQLGKHLIKEELPSLELEDGKEVPEDVAANFTCAMFVTPKDVLKGARHMAAVEIGCEPIVKKYVRGIFMRNAVVSTSPTPEGKMTIDEYHELAGVKWLRNKPLSAFVDAQWLLIQKAEEEKVLQVTIKLPEDVRSELFNDATESYLSDRVSKSAQLWNEQRKMILEDSFSNFILPAMEKEARALLTARAKKWLLMEYGRQLWSKVSVAPPNQKKEAESDPEDESELRVMACCWGPGKPATTFVMLDSAGEVVDVLYAGSISIRSQAVADKQRKQLDQQRLLKFMTDHQPHDACLGNANLSCRQLKDDIFEVIFRIVEDHPGDVSQGMNINIVYADESLPRLYENSRVSSDQLPGQPGIVKRAVGLGRYLQNPLAMVATLCGPGKEILSWKLCPLEYFLAPDEKFEMVEQIMVDATNQVGLDINLAASHEWLFSPLQFISGLGPRKASALQRAFIRVGSIYNRKEIPMGKILRKKVFINAVGFLRVRRSGAVAASSHIMDLLDDTRIHPESYDLAKKMAKDANDEDSPHGLDEMDDDDQEMAIEHVRERPDMLKVLDIDEYTESYYKDTGTRKRETLYLIKTELLHGFHDWRVPFRDLSPEEEFSMLTGETEDSLSEGRIVQVSVRQVQDNRVLCMFDSGLKGFLMAEDFDGSYDPAKIQEGDILTCKIKNVNKQRIMVYLTCKGSDLRRIPPTNHKRDQYYHEDAVNLHSEKEKARKEKELAKKHFKPRMIVHPRFQNLTADEAMQYLSDKDAGESIIRPSSKGPSYLTLTLKVYDGVYAHKDIVEGGKDHKDITSFLRIGKTLQIEKVTFEDLDEVMDRYVDPLVGHLKNMLSYHKFKGGKKNEVDDILRADKAENPTRIVYCFGIAHEHPGTFILSYIRSSNPRHQYVGLYPKGFRFDKKDFENIDKLESYFQRNIDKLDAGLSMKSTVAARVPMESPASWVSSGDAGGNNDRWNSGGRSYGSDGQEGRGRGRGRGRGGRGRGRDRDSDFDSSSRWGPSGSKNDDDGALSSFPGAKVQNSSGRENFPGGWGDGGSGGAGGSGTGGTGRETNAGGGWVSNRGGGRSGGRGRGGGSWGGDGNGDGDTGGGWGGNGGGGTGRDTNAGRGWVSNGGGGRGRGRGGGGSWGGGGSGDGDTGGGWGGNGGGGTGRETNAGGGWVSNGVGGRSGGGGGGGGSWGGGGSGDGDTGGGWGGNGGGDTGRDTNAGDGWVSNGVGGRSGGSGGGSWGGSGGGGGTGRETNAGDGWVSNGVGGRSGGRGGGGSWGGGASGGSWGGGGSGGGGGGDGDTGGGWGGNGGGGAGNAPGGWGTTSGGGGGWGGEAAGNSDAGGGSKRLVTPQAKTGNEWGSGAW